MTILYQAGDGIEGELILFKCRKLIERKRPVPDTSAHRAKAGKLQNAFCVINRTFRTIPERQGSA